MAAVVHPPAAVLEAVIVLAGHVVSLVQRSVAHPTCPARTTEHRELLSESAAIQAACMLMSAHGLDEATMIRRLRDCADQLEDGRGEARGDIVQGRVLSREARAKGQVT